MANTLLSKLLSERVRRHSDEVLVLVLEAFREGQSAGAARAAGEIASYCDALVAELERQHDELTPERVEQIEATYEGVGSSAVIAAYFGGSAAIVSRIHGEARRLGLRGPRVEEARQ